jgi:hypothetical protein
VSDADHGAAPKQTLVAVGPVFSDVGFVAGSAVTVVLPVVESVLGAICPAMMTAPAIQTARACGNRRCRHQQETAEEEHARFHLATSGQGRGSA